MGKEVLKLIRDEDSVIEIGNAAWLPGAADSLPVGINSLASWILCRRHNHALSRLDAVGTRFYQLFRDDQRDLSYHEGSGPFANTLTLANGADFERWMLKVLWGAIEAGTIRIHGEKAYRFRLGVTREQLAEILWRGAPWPRSWGLYALIEPHDPMRSNKFNSVTLRWALAGSEILAGFMRFGHIELCISFETPPVPAIFRPGGLVLRRAGFENWKLFGLAWPEEGHGPLVAESQVGPDGDVHQPPFS